MRLMGLAVVFAVAGSTAAIPPGEPVRPQVDGREPTPIARDYHEPEAVASGFGTVPVFSSKSQQTIGDDNATVAIMGVATHMGTHLPAQPAPSAMPFEEFVNGLHDAVMNYMTMPLGTVPIEN